MKKQLWKLGFSLATVAISKAVEAFYNHKQEGLHASHRKPPLPPNVFGGHGAPLWDGEPIDWKLRNKVMACLASIEADKQAEEAYHREKEEKENEAKNERRRALILEIAAPFLEQGKTPNEAHEIASDIFASYSSAFTSPLPEKGERYALLLAGKMCANGSTVEGAVEKSTTLYLKCV